MDEKDILDLIRDRLKITITPEWAEFNKRLKVSLTLDGTVISSDSIDLSEIRSDFD